MVDSGKWKLLGAVMLILIDILNLAEQLAVYFISKQNDLNEIEQQRFFFILFGVGGASTFKPIFVHPLLVTLFGISIEVGELVAYLKLLSNTTPLLIVVILFFCLEVIFYLISLFCLWNEDKDYFENFAINCCLLPARVLLYGVVFETQILFLFLDSQSSFRDTFFEILMIFSTYFGLSSMEKASKRCCGITEEEDSEYTITHLWEIILSILSAIEGIIIIITAVVYASQYLGNKDQLKTYDFVIYIMIIISYGSVLVSLASALLCSLCLCATSMGQALISCCTGK